MFLLDTNVVSEMRKLRTRRIDPSVAAWAAQTDELSLYLSVTTILELERGVLLSERRDPAQGSTLRRWLTDHVMIAFQGRVLPIDIAVALRCAALHVPDPRGERDASIAATALVHGMTVVTRNVSDFVATGVAIINPWQH